jgi:hypothetical protein
VQDGSHKDSIAAGFLDDLRCKFKASEPVDLGGPGVLSTSPFRSCFHCGTSAATVAVATMRGSSSSSNSAIRPEQNGAPRRNGFHRAKRVSLARHTFL